MKNLSIVLIIFLSSVGSFAWANSNCDDAMSLFVYDPNILVELQTQERVVVQLFFKDSADTSGVDAEVLAWLKETETEDPILYQVPGFVNNSMLSAQLSMLNGQGYRFSYFTPFSSEFRAAVVEINRRTFEYLITQGVKYLTGIRSYDLSAASSAFQ